MSGQQRKPKLVVGERRIVPADGWQSAECRTLVSSTSRPAAPGYHRFPDPGDSAQENSHNSFHRTSRPPIPRHCRPCRTPHKGFCRLRNSRPPPYHLHSNHYPFHGNWHTCSRSPRPRDRCAHPYPGLPFPILPPWAAWRPAIHNTPLPYSSRRRHRMFCILWIVIMSKTSGQVARACIHTYLVQGIRHFIFIDVVGIEENCVRWSLISPHIITSHRELSLRPRASS